MRDVLEKSITENKNAHFIFKTFFLKSFRLCDNTEKCGRTRQATGDIIRRKKDATYMPNN
jgi:hypothetical protein